MIEIPQLAEFDAAVNQKLAPTPSQTRQTAELESSQNSKFQLITTFTEIKP